MGFVSNADDVAVGADDDDANDVWDDTSKS